MSHRFRLPAVVCACLLCGGVEAADPPIAVETARFGDIAIYPEHTAPATVVSLNAADISAELAARVTELPARVGDVVEDGAVLAVLDCRDYELERREFDARIAALDARLTLARKRLERTRALIQKRTVSEETLDERETELDALRGDRRAAVAGLQRAELDVSRCTVRSPFAGLVTARLSAVGQYTGVGDPLVHLLDVHTLEVSAQVFTDDVDQLGETAELAFENSGHRYQVEVRRVLPAVNTLTRNREVRLLFTGTSALPGAAGKLRWRDPRPHVPGDLLVRRGGELGVFVLEHGAARFVALPEAQAGRMTVAPLEAGARLVVSGHLGLRDGASVSLDE